MNILSGLLRPTGGDILLGNKPVRFSSPTDAERQGIGMVHQHFLLVPPLSVKENLLLGASPGMGGPLSYPITKVLLSITQYTHVAETVTLTATATSRNKINTRIDCFRMGF